MFKETCQQTAVRSGTVQLLRVFMKFWTFTVNHLNPIQCLSEAGRQAKSVSSFSIGQELSGSKRSLSLKNFKQINMNQLRLSLPPVVLVIRAQRGIPCISCQHMLASNSISMHKRDSVWLNTIIQYTALRCVHTAIWLLQYRKADAKILLNCVQLRPAPIEYGDDCLLA